jgi:hypothetical protein
MAMTMVNAVFWDAIPCIITDISEECAAFTYLVQMSGRHLD